VIGLFDISFRFFNSKGTLNFTNLQTQIPPQLLSNLGGQFARIAWSICPDLPGQFAPDLGGQFARICLVNLHRILQLRGFLHLVTHG
jgi:hypothetical protein